MCHREKIIILVILSVFSFSCSYNYSIYYTNAKITDALQYLKSCTPVDYEKLLDSLNNYHTTDFYHLRLAYSKTKYYQPNSVKEGNFIKAAEAKADSEEFIPAIIMIDSVLKTNYVSLTAHILDSYLYYRLADTAISNYHRTVYFGLLNSIAENGDGLEPNTAFIVINIKEEYELLDALELSFIKQDYITKDGHTYDILTAKNKKTGKEESVYFNVDIPDNHLYNEYKKVPENKSNL